MKNSFLKLSVKASLIALVAGEAFAAGAKDDYHGAKEASSGLPQMDPTWFPSQVFWLAVTFLCLYAIFSRKILPEISATLETRREQIEGDLKTAEELKEEAEAVHQAYEKILEEARADSSAQFAKVEEKTKKKLEDTQNKFKERSTKEIRETEEMVEQAKKEAMGDMHAIAAEVASAAAEKIVGISTDIKQAKTLVKNIDKKAA